MEQDAGFPDALRGPFKNSPKYDSFLEIFGQKRQENARFGGHTRGKRPENAGSSYTTWAILHPILHRKLPMYKGIFMDGCRNVGENQKKFF